jgi:DNA polymerase-1
LIPRPRALLIDGTASLYRAYFAIRSLIGRDGSQVNAVYGFTQSVLELLRVWRPQYAAAAFDDPAAPTFRHTLFSEYKRARPVTPDRLAPQIAPALAASQALGVPPLQVSGFEADDILATLVRSLRAHEIACVVVAADKDLAQLVGPGVWLAAPDRSEAMDAEAVRRRYGVPPERIPDLLALRGDSADGIPGVPGIGERTALRLLAAPGACLRLADDPAVLEALGVRNPQAVATALREGQALLGRNRSLTTLRDDVPLHLTETDLAYRGIDREAVRAMGERLGFDRLREQIMAFEVEWVEQPLINNGV